MAVEYSIVTPQIVAPNQPAVFQDNPCPGSDGLVYKKSGGVFLLANNAPRNNCNCGCTNCRRVYLTNYIVGFHGNVQVPTGGTVDEIRLALLVDGVIDPASIMIFDPTAAETPGNVGTSIIASVPSLCGCDSIALVNIGTEDVEILNGSLIFSYTGVTRLR